VGSTFEARQELKDACNCYAIEAGFEFRTVRYYKNIKVVDVKSRMQSV
jgi:hypothetical protein